jgi:hypothetical protein
VESETGPFDRGRGWMQLAVGVFEARGVHDLIEAGSAEAQRSQVRRPNVLAILGWTFVVAAYPS